MSNSELNNNEKLRYFSKANKEIILWRRENEMINSLADKLQISNESAVKLANLRISTDINKFKEDLKKELNKMNVNESEFDTDEELNDIIIKIQNIQNLIKESRSKTRIEIASFSDALKKELEKLDDYKIASSDWISSKFISNERLAKIESGETLWDNLAWAAIWSIDTVYSIWNYWKDLLVWIAKTPVDLYKIATQKAEIDSFKNV